jgi:predicted DNA-binding transcriptional regulator AlpA
MADAVSTYSSVLPWLSSSSSTTESTEANMWMESLLVRLCQLSDQSTKNGEHTSSTEALGTYRHWASHWDATAKSGASSTSTTARHRRLAWKAYYDTLSHILRQHLPYEPEAPPSTSEKSPLHAESLRLRQRAELKRVETIYEGLLLKETQFPKASETNHEVEAWVDSVIDNWRLLCGPAWTDSDLGEGGKEGVARSVLDVSVVDTVNSCSSKLTPRRYSIGQLPRPSTRPRFYEIFSSYTRRWPSSI